ncbi:MAG: hypothetical protein NVS2B4_18380 [Ramlibacter sp.]
MNPPAAWTGRSQTWFNKVPLAELAEKGADIDVLRQMVQFMAQRLMELDVEALCGAGYDEKSVERLWRYSGWWSQYLASST